MHIEEINEDCEDISDYEDRAIEILDEYCTQLQKEEGMTISIEEADKQELNYEESWAYLWSDKAGKLINAEMDRLYSIAEKYYPNEDITIQSYMYQEG